MFINLVGTTGTASGCTLLPYTDYPDPVPNSDPASKASMPLLPSAPRRKLRLDCSKMVIKLSEIAFTYEDAQCKTCQPNCCWDGHPPSPIPTYDGKLQLSITGVGGAVIAEADFIDAVPKP